MRFRGTRANPVGWIVAIVAVVAIAILAWYFLLGPGMAGA
jgi:hypothetical protein